MNLSNQITLIICCVMYVYIYSMCVCEEPTTKLLMWNSKPVLHCHPVDSDCNVLICQIMLVLSEIYKHVVRKWVLSVYVPKFLSKLDLDCHFLIHIPKKGCENKIRGEKGMIHLLSYSSLRTKSMPWSSNPEFAGSSPVQQLKKKSVKNS